ncbi:PREDICTED: UPF0687 protein C20orf27 homolog isoform X1 [Rhagoletis zephyria]|uniref:UPF0687 protein C20orf27 homolog isoform X1 n=1 Tax=Rhagoletis zephyria TaxID=28612 RepID=UPI0008116E8A|nr:PREDICTED: UPF0687 protein C20orf27 homolog isoform X1 [Rhagoletis zephyria]
MSQVQVEEHGDHHVHFDTTNLKDDFESDSCVTYQRSGDTIVISLGFLQVNHRYLIDLKLPVTLFDNLGTTSGSQFEPAVTTVPNLHCRITEFSGLKHDEHDFYEMKIEFFAYKEKLLREVIHIVNSNNSQEVLKLMIAARVLGKGKGTPMLRSGIHCIGIERDDGDESEASDFPGFGKGT